MNKKIVNLPIFMGTLLLFISFMVFSIKMVKSAETKSTGDIIVEMTGFKSNNGTVIIGLYNDANGFPGTPDKNSIIMSVKSMVTNNKSIVKFKDVPYGLYAISGYHDENNNGKLDTGMFGIPKEGLIYSNNAKSRFGPPKFDDAKFELNSGELRQVLKIIFYK